MAGAGRSVAVAGAPRRARAHHRDARTAPSSLGDWWQIDLTPDEVQAWLGVLNDTRLVFGTRLGVTEEERELDPADPEAGPYALYQWLTWVQGDLIEELL